MSSASALMVSSSLNWLPSSPRSNSNVQPGYLKSSPPGACMTPSSDANSVTTIRAGIACPLLSAAGVAGQRAQLVAVVARVDPPHRARARAHHERLRARSARAVVADALQDLAVVARMQPAHERAADALDRRGGDDALGRAADPP